MPGSITTDRTLDLQGPATLPTVCRLAIYQSFGPFMCLQLGGLAVLLFFPEISLFLLR